MDFYFVRHGEAKSTAEDPQRPLSHHGRREVENVAAGLVARKIKIAEILHSDKLRAKQTGEILAQSLSLRCDVREVNGLSPQDDPAIAVAELEAAEAPLMLVGHLPHLNRLVSMLLADGLKRENLDFPSATVVCLSRENGAWKLRWSLSPKTA
ncbi:MAG: phosphohistidine phosphatase SixA [Candidatus Binatia bacterium]